MKDVIESPPTSPLMELDVDTLLEVDADDQKLGIPFNIIVSNFFIFILFFVAILNNLMDNCIALYCTKLHLLY